MNKFKPGDRIRIYGCNFHIPTPSTGTVVLTNGPVVRWRTDEKRDPYIPEERQSHYKQCRLIKPKMTIAEAIEAVERAALPWPFNVATDKLTQTQYLKEQKLKESGKVMKSGKQVLYKMGTEPNRPVRVSDVLFDTLYDAKEWCVLNTFVFVSLGPKIEWEEEI